MFRRILFMRFKVDRKDNDSFMADLAFYKDIWLESMMIENILSCLMCVSACECVREKVRGLLSGVDFVSYSRSSGVDSGCEAHTVRMFIC